MKYIVPVYPVYIKCPIPVHICISGRLFSKPW